MNEVQIRNFVRLLIDGVKANKDDDIIHASEQLITDTLVNIKRIADALEEIAGNMSDR